MFWGSSHPSCTLRQCTPIVGVLGVRNGWSLKALQGGFEMTVSTLPFKFPLVFVSTREMRLPSNPASCHSWTWGWLSFLLFGEYLVRIKRTALENPLLCRTTSSWCQLGGAVAGCHVSPHSWGVPEGSWLMASHCSPAQHPALHHSMEGCLLWQPCQPKTRASEKGFLQILLSAIIHRKP